MLHKPTLRDLFALVLFTVLITLHPYFLHAEIIMMETGIHLPAINALFHGAVPYRDFYFLRGPFELYVPALMMMFFGKNTIWLPVFYYAGSVLTLVFCVFIAQQLFRTRLLFYLMVPVLIARTFPRVSYYYWGGMRYAVGFLALLCVILFIRQQRKRWVFLAGAVSAAAFFTSIESAACTIPAIFVIFGILYLSRSMERPAVIRAIIVYTGGFLAVFLPYFIYLVATDSLVYFLKSMYVVVRYNHVAYPGEPGVRPETLGDFIAAMNPGSRYFKYMTPVFCYLFFLGYVIRNIKQKTLTSIHAFLAGMAVYSLVLYAAAFRKIEGHHFEMALQPEKFLLFYLFEEGFLYLKAKKDDILNSLATVSKEVIRRYRWKVVLINLVVLGLVGSSWGYAIQRYNHRFPAFKLIKKNIFHSKVRGLSLLEKQESETLRIARAEGMVVPRWQAEEITGVVFFLKEYTQPDDVILVIRKSVISVFGLTVLLSGAFQSPLLPGCTSHGTRNYSRISRNPVPRMLL